MGVRKNRRFRHNPYTNPTVTDYELQAFDNGKSEFDSVTKARAFLKEIEALRKARALPADPDLDDRIADAKEVIRKADLRNVRRQMKRMQKRGLTPSPELIERYNALRAQAAFFQPEHSRFTYDYADDSSGYIRPPQTPRNLNGCTPIDRQVDEVCAYDRMKPLRDISSDCLDVLQRRNRCITGHNEKSKRVPKRRSKPRKNVTYWEEVLGPEGETLRFVLIFDNNGKFAGRQPTRNSPQVGDIVLDLTTGIKAWIIRKGRRRPTSVTPEMRRIYESSYLYKARQLAAGQINIQEFRSAVDDHEASYK